MVMAEGKGTAKLWLRSTTMSISTLLFDARDISPDANLLRTPQWRAGNRKATYTPTPSCSSASFRGFVGRCPFANGAVGNSIAGSHMDPLPRPWTDPTTGEAGHGMVFDSGECSTSRDRNSTEYSLAQVPKTCINSQSYPIPSGMRKAREIDYEESQSEGCSGGTCPAFFLRFAYRTLVL